MGANKLFFNSIQDIEQKQEPKEEILFLFSFDCHPFDDGVLLSGSCRLMQSDGLKWFQLAVYDSVVPGMCTITGRTVVIMSKS